MLARATSSMARLQSNKDVGTKNAVVEKEKEGVVLVASPGGESDKENWIPGEGNEGSQTRRPLPSHRPKTGSHAKVLATSKGAAARSTVQNGGRNRTKGGRKLETRVFEDGEEAGGEKVDGEVERFMRGELSPSKKGDLDCIQGLLSLSQGNWR